MIGDIRGKEIAVRARIFAIAAYLLGAVGLAAMGAFVLCNGLQIWPRSEPAGGVWPWIVDLGWLAVFALQHSGMARRGFKNRLAHWAPPQLERSIYVAASGAVTLVQPLIWQPLAGPLLWDAPAWIIGVSLAAALGAGLCCTGYDHLSFMGLRQVGIGDTAPSSDTLRVTGAYRWVRHPLMLGTLVFLWAQPAMPPDLALFDGGLTLYVLVAIRLEERDLMVAFGKGYVEYRRRVPALIPWRLPLAG